MQLNQPGALDVLAKAFVQGNKNRIYVAWHGKHTPSERATDHLETIAWGTRWIPKNPLTLANEGLGAHPGNHVQSLTLMLHGMYKTTHPKIRAFFIKKLLVFAPVVLARFPGMDLAISWITPASRNGTKVHTQYIRNETELTEVLGDLTKIPISIIVHNRHTDMVAYKLTNSRGRTHTEKLRMLDAQRILQTPTAYQNHTLRRNEKIKTAAAALLRLRGFLA